MLQFLKKLPLIDLGTNAYRYKTKSKKIAIDYAQNFFYQGASALDIGCRDGYWSEKLKKIGYKTTSIDIEKSYEDCLVVDANEQFPFPENTFDLCWATDIIEHLDSPEKFIKEAKRVLKPGGRLIITTPNSYFWLYSFFKIFGLTAKQLQRPDHKHFFCYNDARKLFPDSEIYGYFPYTLLKFKIKNPWLVSALSPTFVVIVN